MKNKMPWKYRIVIVILTLPMIVMSLVSLLTPYNLWVNPLISFSTIFFMMCALGVDIYGMYVASKLNKKRGITK
ncbi:MAG: hypothetical protein AMDU4_FER2C00027G0018 [Ferroplasma sp. Type II]|jgi:Flp pilus assembly protein TadB|uniref:hypothetical protein n=1 Tax=Ferroplasma sp. Type II TaxID=261388 RepID=UPI000389531E|nr:hypothetical protein [Ferroplasma sp. Type II]EQB74178.1 MAG: hypothetical protein AMDU4_FER2C00027G0018 [Ferroplasma sp. Type II]